MFLDGNYLSSDTNFLERRRRGLQRFLNLLVKHPVLKNERLVSIFLSVDTELSVWRSSGIALEINEEYLNRVISPDFISSWDEASHQKHWRNVKHSAESARDTLTQLCKLTDRISKRNSAMAQDLAYVSNVLLALNQTVPLLYGSGNNNPDHFADTETEGDLPLIQSNIKNFSVYMQKSGSILLDEGSSLEMGLVEDVKTLRDTVISVLEIFSRYERFGGDTIPFLERRIKANETKISSSVALATAQGNVNIRAAEREKMLKSIESDKRSIEFQKNRSWLIRQTITEELLLHQRTQYLITKLLKAWTNDGVKFADLQAENWSTLSGEVVFDTPL